MNGKEGEERALFYSKMPANKSDVTWKKVMFCNSNCRLIWARVFNECWMQFRWATFYGEQGMFMVQRISPQSPYLQEDSDCRLEKAVVT